MACCHYEGSPCEMLDLQTSKCTIYDERFGIRKTVDGKEFLCAPMQEYLMHKPAPKYCGYARIVRIAGKPVHAVNAGIPIVPGMA